MKQTYCNNSRIPDFIRKLTILKINHEDRGTKVRKNSEGLCEYSLQNKYKNEGLSGKSMNLVGTQVERFLKLRYLTFIGFT